MRQYLNLPILTAEGVSVHIVLEIDVQKAFEKKQLNNQAFGRLILYYKNDTYKADLNYGCLNKDITWDQQYLESIKNIFKPQVKTFSASFKDCKFEVKSEIVKGIKILLLRFTMVKEAQDSFEDLVTYFGKVYQEKQSENKIASQYLESLKTKNKTIQTEIANKQNEDREDQMYMKTEFLKTINKVKYQIKTKLNLVSEKKNSGVVEQQIKKTAVMEPIDELFEVFNK